MVGKSRLMGGSIHAVDGDRREQPKGRDVSDTPRVVIVGAGPCGLGAARELTHLRERRRIVGLERHLGQLLRPAPLLEPARDLDLRGEDARIVGCDSLPFVALALGVGQLGQRSAAFLDERLLQRRLRTGPGLARDGGGLT